MTYIDYQNADPFFQDGALIINENAGSIMIAWFFIDTVVYPQGKIFDFHFTFIGGVSQLNWGGPCAAGVVGLNNGSVAGPMAGIETDSGNNSLLEISPNPANQSIIVSNAMNSSKINSINIFNITGQQVLGPIILVENKKGIDISTLMKGVYFLRFNFDSNTVTRKLIIQ